MLVEVKSSPYARPNARLPALVGKGTETEEKADSGTGTGKKAASALRVSESRKANAGCLEAR